MIIALEEHVSTPRNNALWDSTLLARRNGQALMEYVQPRLIRPDIRLAEMEKFGVDHMILSLTSPGAQSIADPDLAVEFASETNDFLVENYTKPYPDKFTAFATVAMQNPQKAADELERAVTKLGMKGTMINGYSNIPGDKVAYLDEPQNMVFWDKVNELNVPVYLHPREPILSASRIYDGYKPSLIGSAWGFAIETGTHAVRLMMSGIFDRYPNLTIILGHLGEGVAFLLPRAAHRLHQQRHGEGQGPSKRPLTDYFRKNFYVTTSGFWHTPALDYAITELGIERVMFSIDYPYEYIEHAFDWWNSVNHLYPHQKDLISYGNAKHLFKM